MTTADRYFPRSFWSAARIWVLTEAGAVEEWPAERLALGYRTSVFKAHGSVARRDLAPGPVILRVEVRLTPGDPAAVKSFCYPLKRRAPPRKDPGGGFEWAILFCYVAPSCAVAVNGMISRFSKP